MAFFLWRTQSSCSPYAAAWARANCPAPLLPLTVSQTQQHNGNQVLSFPQRNQLISIVLLKCRAGSPTSIAPHPPTHPIFCSICRLLSLFWLSHYSIPSCSLWHFYINCFVVVFIEIFEVTFVIVAFGQLPVLIYQ